MPKFEATVMLRVVVEFDHEVRMDKNGLDRVSDRRASADKAEKLAKQIKVPGAKIQDVFVEEVRSP